MQLPLVLATGGCSDKCIISWLKYIYTEFFRLKSRGTFPLSKPVNSAFFCFQWRGLEESEEGEEELCLENWRGVGR